MKTSKSKSFVKNRVATFSDGTSAQVIFTGSAINHFGAAIEYEMDVMWKHPYLPPFGSVTFEPSLGHCVYSIECRAARSNSNFVRMTILSGIGSKPTKIKEG